MAKKTKPAAGPDDRLFWEIAEPLLASGAEKSTMMGHPCLRINGDFFASMERNTGDLTVKLPARTVERDDRSRHRRTVRTCWATVQRVGTDHQPRRRPVGSLTARCARVRARKLINHDDFVEKLCTTDKAACSCGDRSKPSILFTSVYTPVSVKPICRDGDSIKSLHVASSAVRRLRR